MLSLLITRMTMFSHDHMQEDVCMQKVEGAWNQRSWLRVPKQSPYHYLC